MDDQEIRDKVGRKIISALRKFLIESNMESLLAFLQQIGIQYSITAQSKSKWKPLKFQCRLYIQEGGSVAGESVKTVGDYQGGSDKSAKAALCDCLAKFLVGEEVDYHEYTNYERPGTMNRAKGAVGNS